MESRMKTAMIGTALAALLAITYLVYSHGFPGFFQLDDFTIPTYASSSIAWHNVEGKILDGRLSGLSRSLTKLTYTLTLATSGFHPEAFKLQNVLLHLCNGLLVFWLVLLLATALQNPRRNALLIALAVASVWLLHPIQVSTVLYPVQRYVILATFFTLAALIAYTKVRMRPCRAAPWQALLYVLAFVVCWPLAILSKETAALLPLYILALEFFVFRFATRTHASGYLFRATLFLFVAIPLVTFSAYFIYDNEALLAGYAGRDFDLPERLLTELQVLGLYLKLILIPIPSAMSLYHDNFPIVREANLSTLFGLGFWLFLILLALQLRKTAPLFGFGIALFIAAHILESTVIPLELVFEHRNYLALLGIALAFYGILNSLSYTRIMKLSTQAAIAFIVLVLALNTAARAHAWSSRDLLIELEYRENPSSHRLLEQMAMLEFRRGNNASGRSYLQELARRYPFLAAPYLIEIRTYCNGKEIPSKLILQALNNLRNGPLTAFDGNALLTLSNRVLNDKCTALPLGELRRLTNAAAGNPRVHTPPVYISALVNASRVSAVSGMAKESQSWALKALDVAVRSGLSRFKRTVEETASIQSAFGQPNDLKAFVEEVVQQHQPYFAENDLVMTITSPTHSTQSEHDSR